MKSGVHFRIVHFEGWRSFERRKFTLIKMELDNNLFCKQTSAGQINFVNTTNFPDR